MLGPSADIRTAAVAVHSRHRNMFSLYGARSAKQFAPTAPTTKTAVVNSYHKFVPFPRLLFVSFISYFFLFFDPQEHSQQLPSIISARRRHWPIRLHSAEPHCPGREG